MKGRMMNSRMIFCRRVRSFIILLSMILPASALPVETAELPLGWDGTAPAYEVWRGGEKLATVTEQKAVLQLPVRELTTLVVIGIYPTGERIPSEPFVVQAVRLQHSRNLAAWEVHPWFFLPYSTSLFLRAEFIR